MDENRNCNCLRVFARGQLIISFMLMVNILLTLSSLILEDVSPVKIAQKQRNNNLNINYDNFV